MKRDLAVTSNPLMTGPDRGGVFQDHPSDNDNLIIEIGVLNLHCSDAAEQANICFISTTKTSSRFHFSARKTQARKLVSRFINYNVSKLILT